MENRCYNVHVLTGSYASSVNSSLPPVQQTLSCQLVGQAISEATLDHGQSNHWNRIKEHLISSSLLGVFFGKRIFIDCPTK